MTERPCIQSSVTIRLDRTAPQIDSARLPPDLLDCNPDEALATVAALFSSPNLTRGGRYLLTPGCLAVRLLALYGAGAAIALERRDFGKLDSRAARFVAHCKDTTITSFASFARRQACYRAMHEGVIGDPQPSKPGLASLVLDDGRGYSPLGLDLPAEFHQAATAADLHARTRQRRRQLITYAALFAGTAPRFCNNRAEAVVMLALYAASPRITLDKPSFRALRRRLTTYIGETRALFQKLPPDVDEAARSLNGKLAGFVLHRAYRKAHAAKLFGKGAA